MSSFLDTAKRLLRRSLSLSSGAGRSDNGEADLARWREVGSLQREWDSRTILIAGLIPAGAQVLEFGAGRLVLRDHLAPDCTYQPSDLVDRGGSTIVWDLNRGVPELPRRYTHTVFSGVLEYVADLELLIGGLRGRTDTIIASYATLEKNPDSAARRRSGWVSHLTQEQLVDLFRQHGFRLAKSCNWNRQTIYVFDQVGWRPEGFSRPSSPSGAGEQLG